MNNEQGISILAVGERITLLAFTFLNMSVDAGSPGGALSQTHILAGLMRRVGRHLDIEGDALPSDHFDLIGGSGLGAYVVLAIL
jgi:hypothetical protein